MKTNSRCGRSGALRTLTTVKPAAARDPSISSRDRKRSVESEVSTAASLANDLDIIDALLTPSGSRQYDGTHHHVDLDRPSFYGVANAVQEPRPLIWIVGLWGSEKSMARVVRGDGYLPNLPGGPGQPNPAQTAEMRAWLDTHAPSGRTVDLVIEGTTPTDDAAVALTTVAPFADAGASWWIESRWGDDPHSVAGLDDVRQRLEAGPPVPR